MTFLEVLNIALRDVNETPLTETSFTNARGFHAYAKEAVNRALLDIANYSTEWPWLANGAYNNKISMFSNRALTDRKVAVYELDTDANMVDWDTFVIVDETEKITRKLITVSAADWACNANGDLVSHRSAEDHLAMPTHIVRTPDNLGFSLSPIPDKEYTIHYTSWKSPEILVNSSDPLPFPERFYGVLVDRVGYYIWKFRDNADQAQLANAAYSTGLDKMFNFLVKPVFTHMRAV